MKASPPKSPLPVAWQRWVIGTAALGALAAVVVLALHIYDQIGWRRYYDGAVLFGPGCEAAVVPWGGTFALHAAQPPPLKPQPMPSRATTTPPLHAHPGEVLITRCEVDARTADPNLGAVLDTGPVFGETQAYYNGRLRGAVPVNGIIRFPLFDGELGTVGSLTLISRGTVEGNVGMASLLPPALITDLVSGKLISRHQDQSFTEQTIFRVGICALLAFAYIALWLYGLRYPDIALLSFTAGSLSAAAFARYLSLLDRSRHVFYRSEGAFNFAACLAICLFLYLWMERGRRAKLAVLLTAATAALFAAACYAVDDQTYFAWRLLTRTPAIVGAAGLALAGAASYAPLGAEPASAARAARLRVGRWLCVGCAAAFLIQAYFEDHYAVQLIAYVQLGILLLLSATVFLTLSRRQHEYFVEVEKRRRADHTAEVSALVAQTAQMLAHDIRRPFNMVRVYSEHILDLNSKDDLATFRSTILPSIEQAQQDVDGLLVDLMALRPTGGAAEAVELAALARRLAEPARAAAQGAAAAFACEAEALWVAGQPRQLRRVLANLLENAFAAVNAGGTVSIRQRLSRDSSSLDIGVHNTGSYIAPERHERLFAFGVTEGKANGSGLGLAVVKTFVACHGGEVSIASDPVGGTCFWLTLPRYTGELPLVEAPAVEVTPANRSPSPTAKPSAVIVVDDDELQLLAWSLVIGAAVVATYASPEELMAAPRCGVPSGCDEPVFILDQQYDGSPTSGVALARSLRDAWPKAVLVLSTSWPAADLPAALGALDAVISKKPRPLESLLSEPRLPDSMRITS